MWTPAPAAPDGLVARPAAEGDSVELYEWRNDPQTIAASGSTAAVEWKEHLNWFAHVLADPHHYLYLVEFKGDAVGMCRFDVEQGGSNAEVSINLNPAFRGRGLSRAVLDVGIRQFDSDRAGVRLTARIRPTNLASSRIFAGAGFVRVGTTEGLDDYER